MAFANPTTLRNQVVDILNATDEGWGGDVDGVDPRRSEAAIARAILDSGHEVLRALATHPENGRAAGLWTDVEVENNSNLSGDVVAIGIPKIVPFAGAAAVEGYPADPDQIDSWRAGTEEIDFYSNTGTAHDEPDANGLPSPNSARYSLIDGYLKFTGFSCEVPVVVITDAMAGTKIPLDLGPTVVKLSISKLLKEGDNLLPIAQTFAALGNNDLAVIQGGALKVQGLPNIAAAQKMLI